jgi:site-specific recombinase XerD
MIGNSTPHGCTSSPLENQGPHPAALTDILTDFQAAVVALAKLGNRIADILDKSGTGLVSPSPTAPRPTTAPAIAPQPPQESPALVDVVNQLLVAKARAGRNDAWIRALRCSLEQFARDGRGRRSLHTLKTAEIEDWVHSQKWSPRTVKNRLAHLQELWRFAAARGFVTAQSPIASVERPSNTAAAPVHIHTPEQVRTVLRAAQKEDLSVLRHLAIRYFAGLRTSEALRLTEEHIRPHHIEVPGWASKTRQRRLVDIPDNLRDWLALGGTLPMSNEKRARWIAQKASVMWPHNVTRHSWCSYHLALGESASKTSLQAGHSESMLFRHYRAVCTREEAREFFDIRPSA